MSWNALYFLKLNCVDKHYSFWERIRLRFICNFTLSWRFRTSFDFSFWIKWFIGNKWIDSILFQKIYNLTSLSFSDQNLHVVDRQKLSIFVWLCGWSWHPIIRNFEAIIGHTLGDCAMPFEAWLKTLDRKLIHNSIKFLLLAWNFFHRRWPNIARPNIVSET